MHKTCCSGANLQSPTLTKSLGQCLEPHLNLVEKKSAQASFTEILTSIDNKKWKGGQQKEDD